MVLSFNTNKKIYQFVTNNFEIQKKKNLVYVFKINLLNWINVYWPTNQGMQAQWLIILDWEDNWWNFVFDFLNQALFCDKNKNKQSKKSIKILLPLRCFEPKLVDSYNLLGKKMLSFADKFYQIILSHFVFSLHSDQN